LKTQNQNYIQLNKKDLKSELILVALAISSVKLTFSNIKKVALVLKDERAHQDNFNAI
jgi:hypothetical protein